MNSFKENMKFALRMDSEDKLSSFRDRFFIPKRISGEEVIYFAGNSLGLQPKSAREYVEQEMKDWELLGVEGHMQAKNPWVKYHEFLAEGMAVVVGAKPGEVVSMNSLTTNLHLMFVSFYRPAPSRHKVLIEANAFPSDHYAVQSQIRFHGYDPSTSIIEVKPREEESIVSTDDIEDLLDREGDKIALVWIAGVNYYTGQAFDIERITSAAHSAGCLAGFDLAHAAGNLILNLHDWDVDFAVWCNYKYLNGGPGAVGGCFVHEKHLTDSSLPKFLGWWGHDKERRFLMEHRFIPIPTAESWQLSNPPILQLSSLKASLDIFDEAGMSRLRKKSELLTGYLEFLVNWNNDGNVEIITPAEKKFRGCQLSLRIKENGKKLHKRLVENGVICDWREPDVIRLAPVPLYNTFAEVYKVSEMLNLTGR